MPPPVETLIPAFATILMHHGYFARSRELAEEAAAEIVQDLAVAGWDIQRHPTSVPADMAAAVTQFGLFTAALCEIAGMQAEIAQSRSSQRSLPYRKGHFEAVARKYQLPENDAA